MHDLKQSTALTEVFFLSDSSGNPVTGKVDANFTKNISKNGAAFSAMTVTITELAGGFYSLPISAAHSDTVGILTIYLTVSGALQTNLQYRVYAATLDDLVRSSTPANALSVGSDNRAKVDLERWLAGTPLALSSSLVRTQVDTHLAAAKTEIADQVAAELDEAIPELAAVPAATPSVRNALMLLYMTMRNQLTASTTEAKVRNDAGTVIAKSTLTDDGTTFTRAKMVNGP